MLSPALADYLTERRTSCNARFAAARARRSRLSPEDFASFLRDQLSPLATALAGEARHSGSAAFIALDAAYDVGLQLVAEKLAGPNALDASTNDLWTSLFPLLASHILKSPRQVIGGLVNIRHHVATALHGREDYWRRSLGAIAPLCENHDQLLDAAKILAWRSGLPQFRASALELAAKLPPRVGIAALDAPSSADLLDTVKQHAADPWFGYGNDQRPFSRNELTRRFGAFRGFGGLFLSPPKLAIADRRIVVSSAEEGWIVVADAFGAALLPAARNELIQARPNSPRSDLSSVLPYGFELASAVETDGCFALTSKQSHSVWIGPVPLP